MRAIKTPYCEWPLEGELFEIFSKAFSELNAKTCWEEVKSARAKYFYAKKKRKPRKS